MFYSLFFLSLASFLVSCSSHKQKDLRHKPFTEKNIRYELSR